MVKHVLPPHDHLDERQFVIAVRRLADCLSYGSDSSPFLGAGTDYVQSRVYQPGDPVKFIDWRVTARTGKVYVKEFEAPKRMPIYLLLDTSASMCVSSRRMSKYAWAVQLAAGIALAAQSRMSPVGILGCGEKELHVKPTLLRNVVYQWSHQLRHHDFREKTRLGESVRQLTPSLKNKCLIFVLSDLHDPDAVEALKLLAQEHDCVVLQLQDPAERGKVGGGIFRAQEAETGEAFVGHGRSVWLDHTLMWHELNRCGVDHLLLETDRPFLPKLRQFLQRRDYFGKGSR
ncbi:MAG: DUF58 domain-containing protein [Sedimentisphaerales bacterium]|nr:DUF58 domain-containing protein [Sedimentisphaerales bacterium]